MIVRAGRLFSSARNSNKTDKKKKMNWNFLMASSLFIYTMT